MILYALYYFLKEDILLPKRLYCILFVSNFCFMSSFCTFVIVKYQWQAPLSYDISNYNMPNAYRR